MCSKSRGEKFFKLNTQKNLSDHISFWHLQTVKGFFFNYFNRQLHDNYMPSTRYHSKYNRHAAPLCPFHPLPLVSVNWTHVKSCVSFSTSRGRYLYNNMKIIMGSVWRDMPSLVTRDLLALTILHAIPSIHSLLLIFSRVGGAGAVTLCLAQAF